MFWRLDDQKSRVSSFLELEMMVFRSIQGKSGKRLSMFLLLRVRLGKHGSSSRQEFAICGCACMGMSTV